MEKCVICEEDLDDKYGNNAEPVKVGRCCSKCNITVVIPKRLELIFNRRDKDGDKC